MMLKIRVTRERSDRFHRISDKPYRDIIEYMISKSYPYDDVPSSDFFEGADFLKACCIGQPDIPLYFYIER
jgi:hypothetical protein